MDQLDHVALRIAFTIRAGRVVWQTGEGGKGRGSLGDERQRCGPVWPCVGVERNNYFPCSALRRESVTMSKSPPSKWGQTHTHTHTHTHKNTQIRSALTASTHLTRQAAFNMPSLHGESRSKQQNPPRFCFLEFVSQNSHSALNKIGGVTDWEVPEIPKPSALSHSGFKIDPFPLPKG